MVDVTETTQYVREAPQIEAYKLGLYQDAKDLIAGRRGVAPPTQAVAGLTSEQLAAGQLTREGIGGYEPYLQGALAANQAGQGMISNTAMPMMAESLAQQQAGIAGLGQARELAIGQMNAPYALRDQALAGMSQANLDLARAGQGAGAQVLASQQGMAKAGLGAANQAFAAQQGIAGAGQLGQQSANRAGTVAGQSAQQAGQYANQGVTAIGQAGRGIPGQIQYAQQQLGQNTGRFDPSGIGAFMDPYTQNVIDAEQAEIARLGEKQKVQARSQQTQAGAFGGSRGAIAEAEINRNTLEQQARTGAQLRSQGYQQAAQQAQQAFEASQGRGLQAASQYGQLGLSGQMSQAQLAQQAAQLGISTEQLQNQMANQQGQLGLSAAQMQQQGAQAGGQLGLSAAQQQQAAAQAGGQLGLSGQQALAQMAGQRANIAQQGGQMGLQYGQYGQQNVNQLAALAQQQGAMGQGIAGLAGQSGQLAGQLSNMGAQQAQLGSQAQQQRAFDTQQLMQYGGVQQQQAQNVLNAQYAAEQGAYNQPLADVAFLGDMTKALPSSQSAVFQQQAPSPGLAQTAGGLAMGAAGVARAF